MGLSRDALGGDDGVSRSRGPSLRRSVAAGAVIVLASGGAPAGAFRTAADLPGFEGAGRVRWAADTIHYEVHQWLPPGLDPISVDAAIARAAGVWTALPCAPLNFVSDGWTVTEAATGDGTVTIQWVNDGWTARGFDADAAATTELLYVQDAAGRWRIADASVFLNAESFIWSAEEEPPVGDVRDLQAVLVHELGGHVTGLAHCCEVDGADGAPICGPEHDGHAMHPLYDVGQRSLAQDDIDGACFLYAPPECQAAGCPGGMACTFDGCGSFCDGVVCLPGDRCGPDGCTAEPCAAGSCERGCAATCPTADGADGDPCAGDLECASGACLAVGVCGRLCAADGSCPEGTSCDESGRRECVPEPGGFGDACSGPADCASALCLAVDELPPTCTVACGDGEPECPEGHLCASVEGTAVCAPPPPSDTGCAVGGRCSTGGRRWLATALLGWLCLLGASFGGARTGRRG